MSETVVKAFQLNERSEHGHHGLLPNVPETMKALITNIDDYMANMESFAKSLDMPPQSQPYSALSFLPDPSRGNVIQPPGMSPEAILKVCRENFAPNMIIQSRLADVKRYSQVSSHPWRPGWRIELRDGRKHPTKTDLQEMRRCERFLLNCNIETDYEDVRTRDRSGLSSFSQYLQRNARDLLRFDAQSTHTQVDMLGRVIAFSSLPAGSIRLCTRAGYENNPDVFAVMVDQGGSVQVQFTRDDLVWSVGNPRNDPGIEGYGYSPCEMAVRLITGFQNALDLNISTFDRNGIPNGFLKLIGDAWSDKPMDALARMWLNMKRGISKYWALPAIGVPKDGDIQVVDLNSLKDTDVRYKDHMNMVMGGFCTVYNFPVRRLGYHASGSHRDAEPAPDGSTTLVGDDDPGLAPLLIELEEHINGYLVAPRWPNLVMRFTGKEPKSEAREYEARSTAMTWNERRAEADLKPLSEVVPAEYRDLAELMGMCPADSNNAATFQTIAPIYLNAKYGDPNGGEAGGGKRDPATPGRRTGEKRDPAQSESKGKTSGVRRDSRAEASAATAT